MEGIFNDFLIAVDGRAADVCVTVMSSGGGSVGLLRVQTHQLWVGLRLRGAGKLEVNHRIRQTVIMFGRVTI